MELLKDMDAITQFELLAIVGSLIGMWVKFQSDYTMLKSRVNVLEADNGELKNNIKQLLEDIQEIKLLLAKNKMT
jgi:Tfp pilus assembly protein PilN|tara:strand:+ start:5632 stop:5856 length:225 start_codon:yes stop_codon:yes gene_type:complete